jgi:hypothetical protein
LRRKTLPLNRSHIFIHKTKITCGNEPKVSWKANGKKLNQPEDPLASIDVIEYLSNVSMPEGNEPFGIPIDAPLAVSMTKALWEKVSRQPQGNPLLQLLEGSYAITFDRNLLLKTEIPTHSLVAEYGYPPRRLQQTGLQRIRLSV